MASELQLRKSVIMQHGLDRDRSGLWWPCGGRHDWCPPLQMRCADANISLPLEIPSTSSDDRYPILPSVASSVEYKLAGAFTDVSVCICGWFRMSLFTDASAKHMRVCASVCGCPLRCPSAFTGAFKETFSSACLLRCLCIQLHTIVS